MTPDKTPGSDGLTDDDIKLCYRLFLDRLPATDEVERMKAAHDTLDSVRRVFLRSSEFSGRYAAVTGRNAPQAAAPKLGFQEAPPKLQPCNLERTVFLHVPKCGGTTLHHMLSQWFGPMNMHPERNNDIYRYSAANLASSRVFSGHFDFYATTLMPGPKKLISFLRDPAERLVSLYNFHRAHTRKIIERDNLLLPRWANKYDIDAYFAHPDIRAHSAVNNSMVRYFSDIPQVAPSMRSGELPNATLDEMLEQALANLEKFAFVGFMDRYDADVDRLADTLGRDRPAELRKHQVLDEMMQSNPNMRKIERQRPSSETRENIEGLIYYDRLFYARARELFS